MKRVSLAIVAFFSFMTMANARNCFSSELADYRTRLTDVSYNLTYTDYYVDMNGDFLEGYFKIELENLPEGYYAAVSDRDGVQYSTFENGMHLNGGVYELEIYNNACDNAIKTYEIKIPHYKQFCELEGKCDKEEIWFDGTYENKVENHTDKKGNKISMKLVIVLVSLFIILVASIIVIFVVRRRQSL